MIHKLSRFLTGFVTALFILTSCTQPATPEPTTPPTIAPAAQPTVAPTPILTLEPTPTPTYSQQANQLLLVNGRFTPFSMS